MLPSAAPARPPKAPWAVWDAGRGSPATSTETGENKITNVLAAPVGPEETQTTEAHR